MKSVPESTAVGRARVEEEEFVSRKLIRPTLRKVESQGNGTAAEMAPSESKERPAPRRSTERMTAKNGAASPEQTHAEDFYYQKQMAAKTMMSVVLRSGEIVQGVIEWYDRNSIKLNRAGRPNLLIYKPSIRYMHKSDENR